MFYSLHSVKINFKGIRINAKWKLDIELTDTYDFTEILSNGKYKDKNKSEKHFKTRLHKNNIFLSYVIILISVILPILAGFLVEGLIAENKVRQKEIDRLYKEGICNYEEPCDP